MICCQSAYSSILTQFYSPYLAHILGFGSLVESKWCHYVNVEADSHLKLLPTSILHIYKVFEHIAIDMLSICISPAALYRYPSYLAQNMGFWVTCGSKWCHYVKVNADRHTSNCIPHSNRTYRKCLSTLICCPSAYNSSLTQFYSPYLLAQNMGLWVTYGVKMMSLRQGWGWPPLQTASHIHITHRKCLSTLICCPSAYNISLTKFYSPYLAQILGFWVTCGVKMMSLRQGWGWQLPQTASHIQIRHIQSVWAYWYAVHQHTTAALHSFTHPTWLRCWGSGSLMESKWYHYVKVEADSHFKLPPSSILHIYKVFEHIDMLSISIQHQPY